MLSRWQSTIVDAQGNVQPLANLTVRNESDQSLAKMWASPGTTQPLPDGMVQADGNGYAYFYAEGGLYRITSVALGIDWRHVPLGELAGMDVADLGLGTAATRDVGTEPNEIPTNDDLGSAAYLPIATTSQAQELTNDAAVITPWRLGEAMNAHVLGMGQTWQDMTASRSFGTTYTNTTGRPIALMITQTNQANQGERVGLSISVPGRGSDNQAVCYNASTANNGISVTLFDVILPGQSYTISDDGIGSFSGRTTTFRELR